MSKIAQNGPRKGAYYLEKSKRAAVQIAVPASYVPFG